MEQKMKSMTAQDIIKEYTEYAEIQGQSMLDGNNRTNNKMVKRINTIFKELQSNSELAKTVLKQLLSSNSFKHVPMPPQIV